MSQQFFHIEVFVVLYFKIQGFNQMGILFAIRYPLFSENNAFF